MRVQSVSLRPLPTPSRSSGYVRKIAESAEGTTLPLFECRTGTEIARLVVWASAVRNPLTDVSGMHRWACLGFRVPSPSILRLRLSL